MGKGLEGRRVLVTGAAQGIGLACARRFVSEGACVLMADIDDDRGETEARLLSEQGVAKFTHCDVSERDNVSAAVNECCELWGGIDVMVNNAGVVLKGDILSIDDATFDRVLAINLLGAFYGVQLAARRMVEAGNGGVIINMSSVNALLNIENMLAYNVSKGGMNQLTRNAAITLAPHKVRVCGVGPGTILTELARNAVWNDEDIRSSILARTPIGRAGKPEEIAAIVAFLASDDASYITGETIYADGGRLGLNYMVKPAR